MEPEDMIDDEMRAVMQSLAEETPAQFVRILDDMVSDETGELDGERLQRLVGLLAEMDINFVALVNDHPEVAEELWGQRRPFDDAMEAQLNRAIRRG